jgi:excisionase family DNA binding protein
MNEQRLELVFATVCMDQIVDSVATLVIERLNAARGPDNAATLMTVAEAAAYLRCKPQRIYDLVSSRRLPKFKDGARTLVRRCDLDAHITSK